MSAGSKLDHPILRWSPLLVIGGGIGLVVWDITSLPYACLAFGVVLTLYCGHVLLWRLQSTLLDCIAATAFLGNVLGLTVGIFGFSFASLTIVPLLVGWTAIGMVNGIVYARLLRAGSPLMRMLLLLFGWAQYLSLPFLIISGILEIFGRNSIIEKSLGRRVMSLSIPMLVCGTALLLTTLCVHWMIRRAARRLAKLDIEVAAPRSTPSIDPAPLLK